MPALDNCHQQVVAALIKNGWSIRSENEFYRYGNRSIFIDLRAERLKDNEIESMLLAEIKCFNDEQNQNTEWYSAIGQYLIYQQIIDILRCMWIMLSIFWAK